MDLSFFNINFWILQSIAMGLTALFIPRLKITSFFGATQMVIALALVNSHIWDTALFFSVPDSFTTHALVLLGSNAVIFWVLVKVLPGIEVSGILPAVVAPVVFSVISLFLNAYGSKIDFLDLAEKGITMVQSAREDLKSDSETESDKKSKDKE
jgi:uncharacterized membrane protein YvlD (DUF360 family)